MVCRICESILAAWCSPLSLAASLMPYMGEMAGQWGACTANRNHEDFSELRVNPALSPKKAVHSCKSQTKKSPGFVSEEGYYTKAGLKLLCY